MLNERGDSNDELNQLDTGRICHLLCIFCRRDDGCVKSRVVFVVSDWNRDGSDLLLCS